MAVSVITPSFRNSNWLRLCIASVADQQGVQFEHIVQDAVSDDGTQEWLPKDRRVKAFIEKDRGMYDAVNRGFSRASGDIFCYLNCDEQFLPGALKAVEDFFTAHPEVDVVVSDTVVTDSQGQYQCHRYSLVPIKHQMWVRFSVLTCALFVRRRIVHELDIKFDIQYRDLGDWYWIMDMLQHKAHFGLLPQFTSVFTDTGENMNLKPNALRERWEKWEKAPRWIKLLSFPTMLHHRVRLALRPPLLQRPFDFSLYTLASPNQRVSRHAAKPTSFWKARWGTMPAKPA